MNLGCSKSSQRIESSPVKTSNVTGKLDNLVLNRFLGIPIFLALIYLVFTLTIKGGGYIQSHMSVFFQFLFIEKVAGFLQLYHSPEWLIALLANGLGQGLQTTLCFIPIIAIMFFCLSYLETSGYMARAAVVMDKTMRMVGLTGQSFMPMILGFGCNVPALLATRSLKDPTQRILTILMTPFMSCGARLAVYALFVAAFFPENGSNIIFALYMVGIFIALATGGILGKALKDPLDGKVDGKAAAKLEGKAAVKTVQKSESLNLCLNLPAYQWPRIRPLLLTTTVRVKSFILNAGMIIIPLCILIGALGIIKTEDQESYMTRFGRHITPIFAPMGIEENNWQATVGLLSGLIAKEVMVGTLTALYAEPNFTPTPTSTSAPTYGAKIAKSPIGSMVERFASTEAAIAYLLFVLLYFPCISVLATISRELSFSWALFSSIWTTGLAYGIAVLFYQTATFSLHPSHSLAFIITILFVLGVGVLLMKRWASQVIKKQNRKLVPTRLIVLGQ